MKGPTNEAEKKVKVAKEKVKVIEEKLTDTKDKTKVVLI